MKEKSNFLFRLKNKWVKMTALEFAFKFAVDVLISPNAGHSRGQIVGVLNAYLHTYFLNDIFFPSRTAKKPNINLLTTKKKTPYNC